MDDRGAWKVGLITLLALALALGTTAFLVPSVRSTLTGGRWSFYLVFSDAGGLQPAEKVTLAGVSIGTVDSVRLVTDPASKEAVLVNGLLHGHKQPAYPPPYALVKLNIDKNAAGQLYHSYTYEVGSTSVLGTNHQITVTPASPVSQITPGDIVVGTASLGLSDIAKPAAEMMTAVTSLTKKIDSLAGDPRLKDDLMASLDQVHAATENVRLASAQIRYLADISSSSLGSALPHVGSTLNNLDDATANVRKASDRVPHMMDEVQGSLGQIQGNLVMASKHADEALQNVTDSTAKIKSFTNDSGTLEDLHATLANFKQSSDHLAVLIQNFQNVAGSPEFQKDLPQVIANLKDATAELTPTLRQARETLSTLQATGQTANSMLGGVNNVLHGGPAVPGGKPSPRNDRPVRQPVGVVNGVGLLYTMSPNSDYPHRGLVDPEYELIFGRNAYYLGLYDLGGQDKITLEMGSKLLGGGDKGVNYRYGVYRARAGAGLDWILSPNLGIYGTLYNPNKPTVDLESTLSISRGYSLWAGIDQLNQHPRPFIGVRGMP